MIASIFDLKIFLMIFIFSGIDIVGRHIRMCLFDGQNVSTHQIHVHECDEFFKIIIIGIHWLYQQYVHVLQLIKNIR